MKNILYSLMLLALSAQLSLADSIGGNANVDFSSGTLTIPCVKVQNLDPSLNGNFFDVTLERQGETFSFGLSFAETEDTTLCESIGDFASFEDDDFDNSPDDSADDSPDDSPAAGNSKILVRCEKRVDRSKVSVDGNNLAPGNYSAAISSGANQAGTNLTATVGDEVEFDFDSDVDDIASGANAIGADFIQGSTVNASIFDANGMEVVQDSATCTNK